MKRLRIDFAAPGARRALHRASAAHCLLIAAGLALCVSVGLALAKARALDQALQARQQSEQAGRAAAPPPVPAAQISQSQANAVNATVQRLNLPWRDLRDALDVATPDSVALLAIEPDPRTRVLTVLAEANGSDAMLAYIEQLKRQPFFVNVTLTKHETNELDPVRPLRFELEAQWAARGATP